MDTPLVEKLLGKERAFFETAAADFREVVEELFDAISSLYLTGSGFCRASIDTRAVHARSAFLSILEPMRTFCRHSAS